MIVKEVTDLVAWPPHWGKAIGVGGERSSHSGLPHVTGIIDLILADMGGKGQYKGEGWPQDALSMAAEMGFSWEECIERGFALRFEDAIERVGEITRDGITGSPDGYHEKTQTLHEYKCKWQSCDNFKVEEQTKWIMQVKSYCKMLGCLRVRFWVFFIVGNWKMGRPGGKYPHPRVYDMEFTQGEVDEHWGMMKRYRVKYLETRSNENETAN